MTEPNEKSAGQLHYERWVADRIDPDSHQAWDELTPEQHKRHEWNATVTPKKQSIKAP